MYIWTHGFREVIALGKEHSVSSHGGNVVGLVYRHGLRTLWYQIEPGQHVNASTEDQVKDFDTIIVPRKGEVHAKLNGKTMLLQEGEAYLITAGVAHEFWNDFERPNEGLLVMCGDGA